MRQKTTKPLATKEMRRKQTLANLELEYRLSELPSAQHRAGLAGLVLMVQWLEQQGKMKGVCKITKLDPYGAVFQLDRKGLGSLFNELFAASWRPRRNAEDIRDAVPNGAFLAEYDPSGEAKLWLSLWQEIVLTVLRNRTCSRLPFVARANGQEVKEAEPSWRKLCMNVTEQLSGTFLLRARAKNAEQVPFLTTAHCKFLLYFWSLVMWNYRLALLNRDDKLELSSYIIAIPDVADLELFCKVFPQMLRDRSTEKIGARIPKASLVYSSAEASLAALRMLQKHLPPHSSPQQAVLGMEVVQVDRTKHDIAIRDFRRITVEPALLETYSIVEATTTNRLFRRQQVSNLVNDAASWIGFASLFGIEPVNKTIGSYTFCQACRSLYEQYLEKNSDMPLSKKSVESSADETNKSGSREAPTSLEEAVYEIVRTYLNRKVAIKNGLSWKDIKHDKKQKEVYNRKKQDMVRMTFYSVRSRSGEDFVEFFTATLCSVSQQMSEQGFLRIAQGLFDEPEKVRTLTLLALSAQA